LRKEDRRPKTEDRRTIEPSNHRTVEPSNRKINITES